MTASSPASTPTAGSTTRGAGATTPSRATRPGEPGRPRAERRLDLQRARRPAHEAAAAPTRRCKHPRCVFQILRRHYARYTPEMVEQVCGTPRETFLKVAETLADASGPDRTAAICYAVGWTQHTTGVQIIRAATILQLLLGNIGRPGGGILALRGHATIQGSTDIPTLYNLLPGYLNTPSALKNHDTLADYIETEISPTSYWVHFPKFIVSLLKAWYGDAATKENDYGFGWLPEERRRPLALADVRGHVGGEDQGLHGDGPEPGRRRPERRLPAPGAGEAGLDGRPRPLRDRDRHLLEGQPRGQLGRARSPRRSPPRSSSCPPPPRPRWTAPTPTPSA